MLIQAIVATQQFLIFMFVSRQTSGSVHMGLHDFTKYTSSSALAKQSNSYNVTSTYKIVQ